MIAGLAAGGAIALTIAAAQAADPAGAALGARIAESARAAERLQGELDGRWVLAGATGEPLFVLQISDLPGGAAPLAAGWRDANGPAMGPVETIARAGGRLTLVFDAQGLPVRLDLARAGPRLWRGWMTRASRRRPVSLGRRQGPS
jgi:hypothetical protein